MFCIVLLKILVCTLDFLPIGMIKSGSTGHGWKLYSMIQGYFMFHFTFQVYVWCHACSYRRLCKTHLCGQARSQSSMFYIKNCLENVYNLITIEVPDNRYCITYRIQFQMEYLWKILGMVIQILILRKRVILVT